jgi:hypothetical protein
MLLALQPFQNCFPIFPPAGVAQLATDALHGCDRHKRRETTAISVRFRALQIDRIKPPLFNRMSPSICGSHYLSVVGMSS